ncbi:PQQ-like beta-propeller repeat protein [Marinobacter sp. CA1]|uniref:PQQ-like beta-propeller repeat protein n=1 Tax=Marinobacter sp. CA1 TaxID=2817656 RepID=UPI001D097169|nr:PQQ-like beta-propeller repeat protein [Marinobacter sp. CA1]UDL06747.1 PQQ-binding-like beta-propeller repeat protein [Marinobacter sp. CA1]
MSQSKNKVLAVLFLFFLAISGCKSVPAKDLSYKVFFHEKTSEAPTSHLIFNHDGSRLLSAPQYDTVSLLKSESGEVLSNLKFQDLISGLMFLDTGEIFIAKSKGSIELWDAELSNVIKSHDFDEFGRYAIIHRGGRWGFYGNRFFSWADSIGLEMELAIINEGLLTFFGSEYAVAVGEHDGKIVTIDLADMSLAEWRAPERLITGDPRLLSQTLIMMTKDDHLYAFDIKSQKVLYDFSFFFSSPIFIMAPPHGDWFAAMYESEVVFYNAETGEKRFSLPLDFPWSGVTSSDREKLFIGSELGSLYVVDVATQSVAVAKLFDQSAVGAMTWHEETNRLAIGTREGETMVIELETE